MLFLLALCALVPNAVEGTPPLECDSYNGAAADDIMSLLQVGGRLAAHQGVDAGEGDADAHDAEDPDSYWLNFDTKGDADNPMPLAEAQALDGEVADLGNFDSLPPLAPLLHPDLVDQHDAGILEKLQNLTRDSQLILPDGTRIPYWQTLQYASRNMRMFITRFMEGPVGKRKVFDPINATERAVVWEMAALTRKILVTDCVKGALEGDPKFPDTITYSKKLYRGAPFSGAIFYRHLEGDTTASYVRLGKLTGSMSAVANGAGITFNNKKQFSERDQGTFVGIYCHEQAHNMGYHHKDNAPYSIQKAAGGCHRQKAYNYTTYDLAAAASFQVE